MLVRLPLELWVSAVSENGGITDISSTSSFHPVSFTKPPGTCSRLFCPRGKRGRMSGGHSESLIAGNIHEVQNSIVWYRTLLSLHTSQAQWASVRWCLSCTRTL